MHCPRCGTSATNSQQFCRSCGLSLEKIAEILGEEVALQSDSVRTDLARLRERQKRFEKLARIAGLTTFSLILLGLIGFVILQMIIFRNPFVLIPGTMLILLALGAGVMGFFQTYSKSLKAKLEERPLPPAAEPLSIDVSETSVRPPRSITEGTTELLTRAEKADTGSN